MRPRDRFAFGDRALIETLGWVGFRNQMAAAEDEDVNEVGEGSGGANQDYLRVTTVLLDRLRDARAGAGDRPASALAEVLEVAAQEFGIERETSICSARVEITSGRCTHSCSDHTELMNPNLWGNLPQEILQNVFAHLPLGEISCLTLLSKEWRQIVSSDDFQRTCSEVHPKLVCLLTSNRVRNLFWVRVMDHSQKWHTYEIRVAGDLLGDLIPTRMYPPCEDQGWVCFATGVHSSSKKKKAPPSLYFNVVNPLTRSSHELPPLVNYTPLNLLRIHVNRATKAFKVFARTDRVVWTKERKWTPAGVAEHVYDSLAAEWKTTYNTSDIDPALGGRLEYDFRNGRLFTLGDLVAGVRSAFYKGRLFVLQLGSDGPANDETQDESPMYYIEEFCWEISGWVQVRRHRCEPFERPPKDSLYRYLYACNGFLMVIMKGNQRFGTHLVWLYDIATGKWSTLNLPLLPVGRRTYDPFDRMMLTVETPGGRTCKQNWDDTYDVCLMCEPQWGYMK